MFRVWGLVLVWVQRAAAMAAVMAAEPPPQTRTSVSRYCVGAVCMWDIIAEGGGKEESVKRGRVERKKERSTFGV